MLNPVKSHVFSLKFPNFFRSTGRPSLPAFQGTVQVRLAVFNGRLESYKALSELKTLYVW